MKEYVEKSVLIAMCKGIAACDWNKRAAPVSWADAYERFADDVEEFDAADVVERKRGEWISVKERLPDIELIEAKAKDRDYFPCLAVIKSTVSVLGRYVSKLWYGEEGFIDQDACPMDNVVTHWMPLPELPNCGADMRGEKNAVD